MKVQDERPAVDYKPSDPPVGAAAQSDENLYVPKLEASGSKEGLNWLEDGVDGLMEHDDSYMDGVEEISCQVNKEHIEKVR